MRVFFRFLFPSRTNPASRQKSRERRSFANTPVMSDSAISAILYAATISSSSIAGAVPDEAKEKRHHLTHGKGFTNPWDSWRVMSGPAILKAMLWYVRFCNSITGC